MQNQTNPQWLVGIQSNQLGTGLFMIPDVQNDNFGATVVIGVKNLTYRDCLLRGTYTIAFKWVPHTVADYPTLQKTKCNPDFCVDTCVKEGCVCDTINGVCVSMV